MSGDSSSNDSESGGLLGFLGDFDPFGGNSSDSDGSTENTNTTNKWEVLNTFAGSPAGFIYGVLLTPLLNGLETGVGEMLYLVNLVFFGDSRGSTSGTLGLADVPTLVSNLIIDAGTIIGDPILNDAIGPFGDAAADVAKWAGPWGLLGGALAFAIIVIVFGSTLRTLVEIVLDIIPGGGAFIN
jgi:hypothetical protein